MVGQEGVSTDPHKIKAVTEWPRPTTVTEVRSFLGFVSYYRRFIPSFSKVAKPLNTLLQNLEGTSNQKKKFKVNWGLTNKKLLKPCKGSVLRLPYWLMQTLKLHLSFTLMPVVKGWGLCYTNTRTIKGGL